jgi:acyl carrier protein
MVKLTNDIELKEFLVERVSSALRLKKSELDLDTSFAQYGLESIDSVILASEIEEEIGVQLEPTVLWEHDTINLCASFLRDYISEQAA